MDRRGSRTKSRHGHPPAEVEQAHVWGWQEAKWKGSQQRQHSHHQPLNPIVRQTLLPELLVQGQQRTEEAECLAKLTSRISAQQLLLYGNPWLCLNVSWRRPCLQPKASSRQAQVK